MKKIGFIGYGSMSSMLIEGFLSSGIINQNQIFVSTRTPSKLELLKSKYPEINLCRKNSDVAKSSDLVFICVKPLEVKTILDEIKELINPDKHIVSIAACVTFNNIEKLISGKISRIIPSLTSEIKEGITLVCHNEKVTQSDADYLEKLLNQISKVKIIKEQNFEVASDLTSCAPGMIASIFQEFVNAGLKHTDLPREDVEEMVIRTLFGTAHLFVNKNMNFDETISRVATKGGITEEGVKVLQSGLPKTFDDVFSKTLSKHETVKDLINKSFQ